jgi:hypothetical protein
MFCNVHLNDSLQNVLFGFSVFHKIIQNGLPACFLHFMGNINFRFKIHFNSYAGINRYKPNFNISSVIKNIFDQFILENICIGA